MSSISRSIVFFSTSCIGFYILFSLTLNSYWSLFRKETIDENKLNGNYLLLPYSSKNNVTLFNSTKNDGMNYRRVSVEKLISDARTILKMRNKNENYFQEIAKASLSVFHQKYFGEHKINGRVTGNTYNVDNNRNNYHNNDYNDRNDYSNDIDNNISNYNSMNNVSDSNLKKEYYDHEKKIQKKELKEEELQKEIPPSLLCLTFSPLTVTTIPILIKKILDIEEKEEFLFEVPLLSVPFF